MKLVPFLLVNLAGLAILHFAWIPSLENRFRIDRSLAAVRRAGLLSLAGFARSVFLVGSLTTSLLIVVILILSWSGGVTTGEITSAVERIHSWRAWLIGVGPLWSGIVMILLIVALGLYSRRCGRRHMVGVFREMYARKFERLGKDYELGNLPEMPPTSEMREVAKTIGECERAWANLKGDEVNADPKIILAKEQLNAQIDLLQRYYVSLDLQRRIDLELDPEDAALPEARTKWEKFQVFFMSRGLVAGLNRTSRALFFATLILLAPSLTGVYSSTIGASLNRRLVELKDLRVELSRKEFEQEKARLGEPKNELSAEDKRDLQRIALNYERTIFQVPLGAALRPTYTLRSTVVRETILTEATTQANAVRQPNGSGANWEQHASGSRIQNLTPLEREVIFTPEQVINADKPVTSYGQRLYVELENIARRSPTFMERLRTGLQSFQEPATSYDICNSLYSQMAGTLAGDASPEMGNAIRAITIDSRYPAFNGFTEMSSREFLSDLMRGASLEDAMSRANAPDSRYPFLGRLEKLQFHTTLRTVTDDLPFATINEKLASYPPTVDVAPEAHVNMTKAVEAEERYKNSPAGASLRNTEANTDSLATFSDWFPAQMQAETKTPRGELLAKLNPHPPIPEVNIPPEPVGARVPGSSGFDPPAPELQIPISNPAGGESWANFVRGRDFSWLRTFSRVGGVLIGRRAREDGLPKLDFKDLRWETDGSHIRLVLIGRDGQQIRSRLFRAGVAYQAINYAADGRPLAATMVSAKPLTELRILLHPTLEDTALGYRILELDRLVDAYARRTPPVVEAESRVYAHDLLYQFVWAVRALAFLDQEPGSYTNPKLRDFQNALRELVQDEKLRSSAREALKELSTIRDPRLSPLTVKQKYYDQSLVEILTNSPPETTLDSLSEKTRALVAKERQAAADSENEERQKALKLRWLTPPPEIIVWSGVRERGFDTNPANVMVSDGAEMLMPFDFMLQVAFESQPQFLNSLTEDSIDRDPWEFPELQEMIQTTVMQNVTKDPRAREIVDDSAEFAMLQRLFRMAMNGQLGENFPVEKITKLHQALLPYAPKTLTRTLRWHNIFGFDVIAAQLEDEQKNPNAWREQPAPQTNGSGSLLNSRPKNIEELSLIEEIRRQLGVAKDDEQAKKEKNAPLPKLE